MIRVRDLFDQTLSRDITDNVTNELYVAFEAPQTITEEGLEHFAEVLDYPVRLIDTYPVDLIELQLDGEGWQDRLEKASDFFWSLAGMCASSDYVKWFGED